MQRLSQTLIIGALLASAVTAAPSATARTDIDRCGFPRAAWERRAPASVGLDEARLQEAFDWANQHAAFTVAVVRRGCLAGESRLDPLTRTQALDGWSMTKSVTSMVVGRAATLGLLELDAPIGPLFPEADASHARLTPRHLLTMTSGLEVNWGRDLNPAMPDRVADALSLPFERRPGKRWEYQQSAVTLLLNAVERAVGEDVQAFAQRELFGPIGIAAGSWTWERDRAGHTEGWAHLHLPTSGWLRLGQLMLNRGKWDGTRLIARWYVTQATSSIAANGAYGLLFWLNRGGSYVFPSVYGPDEGEGVIIPSGPRDMYVMAGNGDQRTYVIPSLDMVIVRLGQPGSREGDTRPVVFTSRSAESDYELVRRILAAVTDAPVPDVPPYAGSDLVLPTPDDGIAGEAQDVEAVLGGAGAGPEAPPGCTPAGC